MRIVGLTGGIATGKSTVAALLRELGAHVIDADEIARAIVRPGEDAWREIVDFFGEEILRADKTIHRRKLRKRVFADRHAREQLESITHPRIRASVQERIKDLEAQGVEIAVYEAPLLFENRVHQWLRPVIVVSCDPQTQRGRLEKRDRLTSAEIQQHLDAQMPLAEKKKLADYVVENDGDFEELKTKVRDLWNKINSTSPAPNRSPRTGQREPDRPLE
jgi:dephospho-CoA kinase